MWPSRPTAIGWPAPIGMAECDFGISTIRTRRSSRLRHTAEQLGPWPFRPMAAPWPPEATMPRSSFGTWLLFSKPPRCADTPDRSMDWHSRETEPFWPVPVAMARPASGARRRSERPGLTEEYSASLDGIRQDFVIAKWSGSAWSALGSGVTVAANILALAEIAAAAANPIFSDTPHWTARSPDLSPLATEE